MNRAILQMLVNDARTTYDEIAAQLKRSKSTVRDRIKKMERDQVIRGYHARVDPEALGCHTLAIVLCNLPAERSVEIAQRWLKNPYILEVLFITGDRRVMVRILAANNPHLREVVSRVIIPAGATDVDSRVVMQAMDRLISTKEPHPGSSPPSTFPKTPMRKAEAE